MRPRIVPVDCCANVGDAIPSIIRMAPRKYRKRLIRFLRSGRETGNLLLFKRCRGCESVKDEKDGILLKHALRKLQEAPRGCSREHARRYARAAAAGRA